MKGQLPEREALTRFLGAQGWQGADVVQQMGAANRHGVYLLQRDGRRAVLKLHEPVAAGRRDAFAHEALLHAFYAEEAADFVARLLAQDVGVRALLFDYIQGEQVSDRGEDEVQRMADFLLETNRPEVLDRARQRRIPAASESGASALEHWQCAMSRLDALLALPANDEATRTMQDFVKSKVQSALLGSKPETAETVEPCLSPSDFGFHNVIRRGDGSLCFLDFEHAGWDDPAKLAADFILQPEAPLSAEAAEDFVASLHRAAVCGMHFAERVDQLLPIQKGKWTAIILNVFGRDSAGKERKAARLSKAMDYWKAPGSVAGHEM